MGSPLQEQSHVDYPDASDPSLVLTHPTPSEQQQTWRLNHGEWGGPLDLPAYLKREPFLASTPLSANGGMIHWILTDSLSSTCPDKRPDEKQKRRVLASCETIRKRVLYVLPSGDGDGKVQEEDGELNVREGLGYGIGSVYTYPEFRGKKYAARMLRELGETLKTWPEKEDEQAGKSEWKHRQINNDGNSNDYGVATKTNEEQQKNNGHANNDADGIEKPSSREVVCSALWSDIGKRFYASKGWPAYASDHVEFPSSTNQSHNMGITSLFEKTRSSSSSTLTLTPVNKTNLPLLCAEDEARLRRELTRHARETGRTAFAFAPEVDVFRWHWSREEFIASHVWPGRRMSDVMGMVATVTSIRIPKTSTNGGTKHAYHSREEDEETKVWAIWTRSYGENASEDPSKNTLYILRLVIDSFCSNKEATQLAFNAVLQSALDAARASNCGSVHLWNPTSATRDLIEHSGVGHRYVHRDVDSIPSMRWYVGKGEGGEEDVVVDWIANEKYCWC